MFLLWVTPLEVPVDRKCKCARWSATCEDFGVSTAARDGKQQGHEAQQKPDPVERPAVCAEDESKHRRQGVPERGTWGMQRRCGRADVLTARLQSTDLLPLCKSSEAGENVQFAPCGRLLQLKLTRPLKAVGHAGEDRYLKLSETKARRKIAVG